MVFVTESYLKKKEEEKELAKKKKEEENLNAKQQVEKGSYVDFKKKMLEQVSSLSKKWSNKALIKGIDLYIVKKSLNKAVQMSFSALAKEYPQTTE